MPGKLFVRVIADLEPTTIADRYCQDTFVVTKSMEWQVVFGLWSRQRRLIGADLLQPFSAFSKKPRRIPLPLLLSGVTDARFFSRLGIQTYGFLPMQLPADFNFSQTIHAANERVPVESMTFGTDAIYTALQRFGG